MRERIESKHVTKEIKSQMPVISPEIIKERGCTFCPYYLGSYEKQPRCMMKNCAWDDENERFHPILRRLIPFYKEKMEKAEEKFLYSLIYSISGHIQIFLHFTFRIDNKQISIMIYPAILYRKFQTIQK